MTLYLEKTLSVYVKKPPCIQAKKLHVRLAFKILLFNHAICQLAGEDHLNARDNYI